MIFFILQSSERLHSAERVVVGLFEKARACELDLARAQKKHIEHVARYTYTRTEFFFSFLGEICMSVCVIFFPGSLP